MSVQVSLENVAIKEVIVSGDFSFRAANATHALDLAMKIKQNNAPLDPVLLWKNETGLILLDGLHRLNAYKQASWGPLMPATVIEGIDRREALGRALRANSRQALQMDQETRLNAAWRLVREPVTPRYKVREITYLTGVGGRTVDKMRARLKALTPDAIADLTGSWWRDMKDRNTNFE